MVDVLVVGAGPAGATLAIDLLRRGHSVRIVDKAPASFSGSRAKGVQPRSLEVFEDLGFADAILAAGTPYPKMCIHLGPLALPWAMFSHRPATAPVPYPNTWLIPQYRTDEALHRRLASLGGQVQFGTELVSVEQDTHGVTATLAADGPPRTLRARFLVSAEGGASSVRKGLAIEFEGSTDDADRILIVDAAVSGLSRARWHVWPRWGGRFIGACPLPRSNLFQWMIRLAPDEAVPQDDADIVARIRRDTGGPAIAIHAIQWKSLFRPNVRLARHYRVGRVFLIGDAAHVHTPAGAQGLNTGVQDAYNLGWKLGQVLFGAADALLDSYEAERRPIAMRVLGLSDRKYAGIGKLDPAALKRGEDEQQLGISYAGGPLAAGGTESALRVGDRMPDGLLVSPEGRAVRLFELMQGPHFTAIAFGARAGEALAALHWPGSGAALLRLRVDPVAYGPGTHRDPDGTLRAMLGMQDCGLVLIRPDGYIAHMASHDAQAETGLAAAIAQLAPPAAS